MKTTFIGGLVLLLGLSSAPALAQEPQSNPKDQTPRVDRREARQKARIRQGVKSGELTKGEATKLRAEERKVKRDESKAKADGKMTPQERRKLNKELNKTSRDIYRKKHNARTRNP